MLADNLLLIVIDFFSLFLRSSFVFVCLSFLLVFSIAVEL